MFFAIYQGTFWRFQNLSRGMKWNLEMDVEDKKNFLKTFFLIKKSRKCWRFRKFNRITFSLFHFLRRSLMKSYKIRFYTKKTSKKTFIWVKLLMIFDFFYRFWCSISSMNWAVLSSTFQLAVSPKHEKSLIFTVCSTKEEKIKEKLWWQQYWEYRKLWLLWSSGNFSGFKLVCFYYLWGKSDPSWEDTLYWWRNEIIIWMCFYARH